MVTVLVELVAVASEQPVPIDVTSPVAMAVVDAPAQRIRPTGSRPGRVRQDDRVAHSAGARHRDRPDGGGWAGVDRCRTGGLRATRPKSGTGWRFVGPVIGRPCDGAGWRGGITGAAVDDGSGGDIVRAIHTVGAGWFVAVVFGRSAVVPARQINVALGHVVEDATAARAGAGITSATQEGATSRAVLVLSDLVVEGTEDCPSSGQSSD